ncbi:hypothetical protein DYB28_000641 [Aphanomyces astaci]|uniref:Uncharacterized protein n=1 Tax=Aphanomyces astaci TaxID=112090 RepID=A0A9X8E9U1_APHAT|nr:hypothetical protein DYB28_000641 [Aphanomyces astaci]
MEEMESAALRALQAHEVTAMRQGHALDNHLSHLEATARDNVTETEAEAWADLKAKQAMEDEAMHKQWIQRKYDLEGLKQVEMQALVSKQLHANNVIKEHELLDEDSMTKRHEYEHGILQHNLAREEALRHSLAQTRRDMMNCKQCYEETSLEKKHELQREVMLQKQQSALQQQQRDEERHESESLAALFP